MSDIFLMRQLENAKMAMTKRNVIRNVKCFFALRFFVVLKRSFVFFSGGCYCQYSSHV